LTAHGVAAQRTLRGFHVTGPYRCWSAPSAAAFVLPGNRARPVASCRNA
jgi:hypothetical protein